MTAHGPQRLKLMLSYLPSCDRLAPPPRGGGGGVLPAFTVGFHWGIRMILNWSYWPGRNWPSPPSTFSSFRKFVNCPADLLIICGRYVVGGGLKRIYSQLTGFEPALPEGIWFRVRRLNHSATTAIEKFHEEKSFYNFQFNLLLILKVTFLIVMRLALQTYLKDLSNGEIFREEFVNWIIKKRKIFDLFGKKKKTYSSNGFLINRLNRICKIFLLCNAFRAQFVSTL